jgi:hypothetical protein
MHISLNFVYLIYLWNGHYGMEYVFSCNYYKYVLLDHGLGLRLGYIKLISKFFINL